MVYIMRLIKRLPLCIDGREEEGGRKRGREREREGEREGEKKREREVVC